MKGAIELGPDTRAKEAIASPPIGSNLGNMTEGELAEGHRQKRTGRQGYGLTAPTLPPFLLRRGQCLAATLRALCIRWLDTPQMPRVIEARVMADRMTPANLFYRSR